MRFSFGATLLGLLMGLAINALPARADIILGSVVSNCNGSKSYTAGNSLPFTLSTGGDICVKVDGSIAVTGTFWQATQPISAASLPLPTGAATSALQTTLNTLMGSPFQAGGSIGNTSFGISGTLPAFAATPTFNLGTLNGAATASNQTGGSQKTQIVDGSGNVIASTSNNLNVQCANCSGSGASAADEASFTAGTSVFAPIGGFFQTTATSNPLTTGQQGFAQMTANRALFSNLRNASGTEVGTSSTPLQVTLANTGSNATSLNVICTSGCGGSGGTSSNFASAFPSAGTAIGVKNGSNMVNLTADGSSNLNVDLATAIPAGTNVIGHVIADSGSTTAVTGTVTISGTVTANAGTNLNTSALALDTSVNGILLAQGSTTSGQSGPVIQGAVTTAAPTYTTGKTDPLSLTTAGALRIDGSGVTQPTSLATLPALTAGSALIGKVGIDQATPGTTNAVAATNLPTTVDTNSGTKSGSTIRVVLATDQPQLTNKLLVTPDANSAVNVAQVGGGTVPSLGTGILATSTAPTAAAAAGITPVISAAVESNHVFKAGAGNFYSAYLTTGATAGYFMVFNATSAPADGAVTPVHCIQVAANSSVSISTRGGPPDVFSTGITAVFSSTGCFTKTASATAFFSGDVQ